MQSRPCLSFHLTASFSLFTSPNGDDILHDEALESRIAALNLLDLDLAHLGVIVDEGDDIAEIDEAVKNAGHQLQKLESSHAARDKMEHLLRTHTVIAGMSKELFSSRVIL